MRYKAHLILVAILLAYILTGCHEKPEGLLPLIEGDKPIYVCGGDSSRRYYKSIWKYIVDETGFEIDTFSALFVFIIKIVWLRL